MGRHAIKAAAALVAYILASAGYFPLVQAVNAPPPPPDAPSHKHLFTVCPPSYPDCPLSLNELPPPTPSPWLGNGTFLNCGGPSLDPNTTALVIMFVPTTVSRQQRFYANETWVADAPYVTTGHAFDNQVSWIDQALNATGLPFEKMFETARVFGGQDSAYNTYTIPVPAAGFYYVRLYFAEVLYNSNGQRTFSVAIEGIHVLQDFSMPALLQAVVKEFLVPVSDGAVDITFIRGAIGDPMVNAIAVVAAPEGMYGLASTDLVAYATEHRVGCGLDSVWADRVGRVWTPADAYLREFPQYNKTKKTATAYLADSWWPDLHFDVPPELLPAQVMETSRTTQQAGILDATTRRERLANAPVGEMKYAFPVQPNTAYHVRMPLMEQSDGFVANRNGRLMDIFVDSLEVAQKLNVFVANNFTHPWVNPFDVMSNSSGVMEFFFRNNYTWSVWTPDVFCNAFEILRSVPVSPTAQADFDALMAGGAAPAARHASGSGNFLDGLGVGVAVGIVGIVGVIVLLLFLPILKPLAPSGPEEDVEDLKKAEQGEKGPKALKGSSLMAQILSGSIHLSYAGSDEVVEVDSMKKGGPTRLSGTKGLYGIHAFTMQELAHATENYAEHNVIGSGGFGQVYKATMSKGQEVAVKRLDVGSAQGQREFLVEIETLSRLHHRNLVNLIGFCDQDSQLCLVYEFVPNGTLRHHLRDEDRALHLTWDLRLKVALGAAQGLEYLHRGAAPPVIHRDIKSSNILLDMNHNAKVADFGLSKLGKIRSGPLDVQQTHISTHVKGTLGYLDPSYYTKQQLTEKSDVYSFGVVLLELITGRMPIWNEAADNNDPANDRLCNLVDWAAPYTSEGGNVAAMVAPQLQECASAYLDSLKAAAAVARRCVEVQTKKRPTMAQVVRELEEAVKLLMLAPAPTQQAQDELGFSLSHVRTVLANSSSLAPQSEAKVWSPPLGHKGLAATKWMTGGGKTGATKADIFVPALKLGEREPVSISLISNSK